MVYACLHGPQFSVVLLPPCECSDGCDDFMGLASSTW
jgi:hypothetical protein